MGELIKSAVQFAHGDHQRMTERSPALQGIHAHLKSVAQIVSSVSQDEETIAAAWLHDVVEDTGVTIGDVERKFGAGVAKLVDELTVATHVVHANRMARIDFAKRHFASASPAAKTVKLADLIDTCRDLHKNEPASLVGHAADAKELLSVLEGGDPRLVARLRRDLERYAAEPPSHKPLTTSRLNPVSVPVAVLRVFQRALAAKDIAEPLISFDSQCAAREVLEAMSAAGVEVVGLHKDGNVSGFVELSSLRNGVCEGFGRKFAPSQVVPARCSLAKVIEVLTRHDRCFVGLFGKVVGVISRRDLHKPAVRMWLFGIVTVAEIEFTERIRQKWPNDSWVTLISANRLERAKELRSVRYRRKEKCQLLDCLQLSDKIEILMADPVELAALGFHTASAGRRAGKRIESLRNSLAHARDFVEDDWPQVVRFARRVQEMVGES